MFHIGVFRFIGSCQEVRLTDLSGDYNRTEFHKDENDLFSNRGPGSLTIMYYDVEIHLWKEVILNPGKYFFIPAEVPHQRKLTNNGEGCDVVVIKIPTKNMKALIF